MFKNSLDLFIKKYFKNKNEEIPAFLLHKLYHQGGYLPFTGASLRFRLMACITNDIVINQKKAVLEFGAGISTIIFARLIRMNNLDTKIVTVDHSADWISLLQKMLTDEGLNEYVTFVHAPIVKSADMEFSFEYESTAVTKALGDTKFDVVVIDGPIAWSSDKRMSRVSNIKYFIKNLEVRYTIFVDDTERRGEKVLLKQLQKELGIAPVKMDPTFASFTKGQNFGFEI